MAIHHQLFVIIFYAFLTHTVCADTYTAFSCSQESPPSCQTFLTYRASSPDYIDLESISTLFGVVNSSSIAKASQLATDAFRLVPDQLIFIPISCTCNGSYYFYNTTTYSIEKADTIYSVTIHAFENLTYYHFVQDMNPQFNPLNLTIGSKLVFPLFCNCPFQSKVKNGGFQYMITYVWQPNDSLESVANMFNTTSSAILKENNFKNFSDPPCLPMKIPVQMPIILAQVFSPPPPPPPPPPVAASNTTSSTTTKSHRSKFSTILSVLIVLLSSMLLFFIGYYMYVVKYKKKKAILLKKNTSDLESTAFTKMITKSSQNQDKILSVASGHLSNLKIYDVNQINEGTDDFNEQNRIGGSVYKVKIKDAIFAVKKTKDTVSDEFSILQKFRHSNLIQLLGMCLDDKQNLFLVFEYAELGSLDKWLFKNSTFSSGSGSGSEKILSWNQRLSIALDLANGLQYMHEHTQPSIVHRDIRTSNIVLDSKFKAKIGNFSMARQAENRGELKVDIFAFGVVLLELISGKKSLEAMKNGGIKMLWKEIRWILEVEGENGKDEMRRWIDPRLEEKFYDIESVISLATLAKACTLEKLSDRPNMADIVFSLCVLSQTSSDMYENKYGSGRGDSVQTNQIIIPVLSR